MASLGTTPPPPANSTGGASTGSGTSSFTDTTSSPNYSAPKQKESPYLKYLSSLFNEGELKKSQANINELNERTSREILRARGREDELRGNEIGQLEKGQTYQLGENERLSNRSLADLAIAKGAATEAYNTMINAGKTVYEAEQAAEAARVEAERYQDEQRMDREKFEYGKTQDTFSNDLAKKKFDEDVRQFGQKIALERQQEARLSAESTGANGVKLSAAQQTKLDSINIVNGQLANYRNLLDTYASGNGVALTGEKAAKLRSAKAALEFAIASAVGTGALQAADRAVVEDMIPDPTSLRGALGSTIRGGKAGSLAGLDQAKGVFDAAASTISSGSAVVPTAGGAQPKTMTLNGQTLYLQADGSYE